MDFKLRALIDSSKQDVTGTILKALLDLNQKHLVLKQFNDPKRGQILRDQQIIIYYATLIMTKTDDKLMALKILKEIEETVYDFIKDVKEKNEFYNK